MKKSIILSTGALAFLLTGCGFKLDDKLLSDDGGVWKVEFVGEDDYMVKFDKDGTLKMAPLKDILNSETKSYVVHKTDDGYELTFGDRTLDIGKKKQKEDSFTGSCDGTTVKFTKEPASYLTELEKKEKLAKKKRDEQERKEKEAREKKINANRKEVFSKVIDAFTIEGIDGKGFIDTNDIDVKRFNKDDKELDLSGEKLTYDVPHNKSLKNGETINIRILNSGDVVYQQKLKISGLKKYAANLKEIKNMNEVKKNLQTVTDRLTKSEETLRVKGCYYPESGKFGVVYITKNSNDDGQVQSEITTTGIGLNQSKIKIPVSLHDNYEDNFDVMSEFIDCIDKEKEEEAWASAIKQAKKSGAIMFDL